MLKIQVVGSGCPNCERLEQICREVILDNGIEANIEKVTDVNRFAELGVMLTPALIVNDKLLCSGKIPTRSTLVHWLLDVDKQK